MNMLQRVEPYVAYGYPNLKTVKVRPCPSSLLLVTFGPWSCPGPHRTPSPRLSCLLPLSLFLHSSIFASPCCRALVSSLPCFTLSLLTALLTSPSSCALSPRSPPLTIIIITTPPHSPLSLTLLPPSPSPCPQFASKQELIYKRGFGKVNKARIPLTDNSVVEGTLGPLGLICVEDLIHEIFTVGPSFKQANNFLWPFKLSAPKVGAARFVGEQAGRVCVFREGREQALAVLAGLGGWLARAAPFDGVASHDGSLCTYRYSDTSRVLLLPIAKPPWLAPGLLPVLTLCLPFPFLPFLPCRAALTRSVCTTLRAGRRATARNTSTTWSAP